MKHSITQKITTTMICIVAGTVLMCWFINTTLLEDYYTVHKQDVLMDTFQMIDKASIGGRLQNDSFEIELEKQCANSNIAMMIISPNQTVIQSNVGDNEIMLLQFLDIIFSTSRKNTIVVDSTDQYVIEKTRDTRLQSDYLVLWGSLQDGNLIVLRTALESIKESVEIANRFLAYVGSVAVVVCGVLLYFVTRKITNPILQLVEISRKMNGLDFEVKFQSRGENEIDLLGEHMNKMAETLEKTISELKGANNQLMIDIEKKNEIDLMRKDFISNVSHELKTPIALIQGYAEGLLECINDDADSREFYCEVIMDESEKMNRMVKNLLTLNQLESGSEQVVFERFDLIELIQGVINATAILREQAGITLEFQGKSPVYVWADEFKTEQVLMNYISNAIHYAIKEKHIDITVVQKENVVRVGVFNTGNPIPEEEIEYIWVKFYKVDKARTREYGGNGIGLSIVKAIMDSFHRECGAINYNNGVEFWFELDSKSQ
ncbi:MAG: HAMP domain-containing sensor histidine kinase [Lachnospiraceae bacterium]